MLKAVALVPAFNEGKRIKKVLEALERSERIEKIIVVDDGSKDNTAKEAQSVNGAKIQILRLPENLGKGGAMKKGLKFIESDLVFMCDADLDGFQPSHIEIFFQLFSESKNKNILIGGVPSGKEYFFKKITSYFYNITPFITGQRLISTKLLREVLEDPYSRNYGVEVCMNYYCSKYNVEIIKFVLEDVKNPWKNQKISGFEGEKQFLIEFLDIFKSSIKLSMRKLKDRATGGYGSEDAHLDNKGKT